MNFIIGFDETYRFKKWYYIIPFFNIYFWGYNLVGGLSVVTLWWFIGNQMNFTNTLQFQELAIISIFVVVIPLSFGLYYLSNKIAKKYWLIEKEAQHNMNGVRGKE